MFLPSSRPSTTISTIGHSLNHRKTSKHLGFLARFPLLVTVFLSFLTVTAIRIVNKRREGDLDYIMLKMGPNTGENESFGGGGDFGMQYFYDGPLRGIRGKVPENITSGNPVYFLDSSQLNIKDPFSASWLQTREEFMTMKHDVDTCEEAAFQAYVEGPKRDKLLLTLDLLDFSVEHLSKWWKILDYKRNPAAYQTIINKLNSYLTRPTPGYFPHFSSEDRQPTFANALAMIAFLDFGDAEISKNLTVVSLAATLESLRRAEIGRVVVVAPSADDRALVEKSFAYLLKTIPSLKREHNPVGRFATKIGHMEVNFYEATQEQYNSNVKRNMPRACLMGAYKAFTLAQRSHASLDSEEKLYLKVWFGESYPHSNWKYVALTEPDSILQSRPNSLQQLKNALDHGHILAPHRLQPLPHHSDLQGMNTSEYALAHLREEDGFNDVIELDAVYGPDVCCDEAKGPDHRPGWNFPNCPNNRRWWACGFQERFRYETDPDDRHHRLRPYQFFRLKNGVGLTTIAGNLFGRRCIPAKKSTCKLS